MGSSQSRKALWGKDEQRNERVSDEGGNEGYGACEDAVEEARAELYREQAEELRVARNG